MATHGSGGHSLSIIISPMTEKTTLRASMLARRMALSAQEAGRMAQAVARQFADHPLLMDARCVAGYAAMRGELNVFPILAMLSLRDRMLALPKLTSETAPLEFRRWQPGEALIPHALGMKEPAPEAAPAMPDLILVPLLAFDASGHRLGYGGGYYDRTLAALRKGTHPPLAIGVAYGFQEVPSLPAEPHDRSLNGILTEHGVSMFDTR